MEHYNRLRANRFMRSLRTNKFCVDIPRKRKHVLKRNGLQEVEGWLI